MILVALIFFLITLIVLAIPLIAKPPKNQPRLESTYKKSYLANQKKLEEQRRNGTITEQEFDEAMTFIARDLLAVSERNQLKRAGFIQKLLIVIAIALPAATFYYYWTYDYTTNVREFDATRANLQKDLALWIKNINPEALKGSVDIPQFNPPDGITKNYFASFFALSFKSAKTDHTDIDNLRLLGAMYLDINDMDKAFQVYGRIYELQPDDFMANYMLLNIQLLSNQGKLDERLEYLYDQLLRKYPDSETLLMQYANILYENGKAEKSIAHWNLLAKRYAGNPDELETYNALQAFIKQIEEKTLQTSKALVVEVTVDKAPQIVLDLPKSAVLFVYLRDAETKNHLPIAAKRFPINNDTPFPLNISIGDYDRLSPEGKMIKAYDHIMVSAHISLTGDPIGKSGDIEADKIEINKGAQKASVLLNSVKSDVQPPVEENIEHSITITLDKLPEIDLDTLTENAALNVFLSIPNTPLPIAAIRIANANKLSFPLTITLTDDDRLFKGEGAKSLQAYDRLALTARLSLLGDSVGKTGDIESETIEINKGDKAASIVLQKTRTTSKSSVNIPSN